MKSSSHSSIAAVLLFVGTIFMGCDKNSSPAPEPVIKSDKKAITDVSFDEFSGETCEIDEDQSRIIVYVPWQSSWDLKPNIRHSGMSVSPENLEVKDFSKPVDYTVTAEDGSSKTYTLIVASAKAGLADVESQYVYGVSFSDNVYYKLLEAREVDASGVSKLEISLGVTNDSRYPDRTTRYFSNVLQVTKIYDSYLRTYSWDTQTSLTEAFLTMHRSTSTSDIYWRPKSGTIKITSYDEQKKVVSGEFTNLKYLRGASFPYYLVSGSFVNVPLKTQ